MRREFFRTERRQAVIKTVDLFLFLVSVQTEEEKDGKTGGRGK